jgi:hypothetical protein
MNELNPTNPFGELLLDLIESQYGGDIDQGIQALVQTTGLSEEEVVGIIEGKHIVEDENLLSAIIDAFPDADEHDLEVIVNVADAVDQDDKKALIQQIEAHEAMKQGQGNEHMDHTGHMDQMNYNEMQGQEQNYPNEEEEIKQQEEYTRQIMNTIDFHRLNEVEQKIADFEYASAVTNKLDALDNAARYYVDNGILPPAHKAMLVGNFSRSEDRAARFEQMALQNNVDVPTMLFAVEFAMNFLKDAADFVEFKDYSATERDVNVAQFSASLDRVVTEDITAIFGDDFTRNLLD